MAVSRVSICVVYSVSSLRMPMVGAPIQKSQVVDDVESSKTSDVWPKMGEERSVRFLLCILSAASVPSSAVLPTLFILARLRPFLHLSPTPPCSTGFSIVPKAPSVSSLAESVLESAVRYSNVLSTDKAILLRSCRQRRDRFNRDLDLASQGMIACVCEVDSEIWLDSTRTTG